LPQLEKLCLCNNQIKRIENLKNLKKLKKLDLGNNLISEPSLQGGAQQMLELTELDLRNNDICEINNFYGFPAVSAPLANAMIVVRRIKLVRKPIEKDQA